MRLPCPCCGRRDDAEFEYGGDAAARMMPAPSEPAPDVSPGAPSRASPDAWIDSLYLRDNPRGEHEELWFHAYGCRRWIRVVRDTRDNRIVRSVFP